MAEIIRELHTQYDLGVPCQRIQDISRALIATCKTLELSQTQATATAILQITENLQQSLPLSTDDVVSASLIRQLEDLNQQLTHTDTTLPDAPSFQLSLEPIESSEESSEEHYSEENGSKHTLYVLSKDQEVARFCHQRNQSPALTPVLLNSPKALIDATQNELPYTRPLLIDLDYVRQFPKEQINSLLTIDQDCIVISSSDAFECRHQAAKLNAVSFLLKPLEPKLFETTIKELSHPNTLNRKPILLVASDSERTQVMTAFLKKYDFEVIHLSSYWQILSTAIESHPSLVLLDTLVHELPGAEIAAVLKQHNSFQFFPCALIESGEPFLDFNATPVSRAREEFSRLPFPDNTLKQTQFMRAFSQLLHQNGKLASALIFDPLTQLLTFERFSLQLKSLVSSCNRTEQPLSVAILDIDHLADINENFGYWAGDRVIQSLSQTLSERLRSSDLIGHDTEHKIAIALPNTELEQCLLVLKSIQQRFTEKVQPAARQQTYYASFSAGISSYPEQLDANALRTECLSHLKSAKSQGRNRMLSRLST